MNRGETGRALCGLIFIERDAIVLKLRCLDIFPYAGQSATSIESNPSIKFLDLPGSWLARAG